MSLSDFKNFTAARMDIDELVSLAAYGRQLRAEYEAQKVDEPEWVGIQLNSLRRTVQSRLADAQEARRRQIKASLHSLKTPAERRAELEKELAELDGVPTAT
jgi:hypothetical protein